MKNKLLYVSVGVLLAAFNLYNKVGAEETKQMDEQLKPIIQTMQDLAISKVRPPLEQIDGLRSVRHITISGQKHTYYDYALMNGEVWSTEDKLVGESEPRDLRPWEQRSLKNKVAFNVWNFGLRPVAEMVTPVVLAWLRR